MSRLTNAEIRDCIEGGSLSAAVGNLLLMEPGRYCAVMNKPGTAVVVARAVFEGDPYGREMALKWDGKVPCIEFYDGRYGGRDALGQFISRYQAPELLAVSTFSGLCLDGGVPAWNLGENAFAAARTWIREATHAGNPEGDFKIKRIEVIGSDHVFRLYGYEIFHGDESIAMVSPAELGPVLAAVNLANLQSQENESAGLYPAGTILEQGPLMNAEKEGWLLPPVSVAYVREIDLPFVNRINGLITADVPPPLRRFALDFCETYGIEGLSDPMYVCNVVALEAGVGDGQGQFHALPYTYNDIEPEYARVIAGRLLSSYSTCIKDSERFDVLEAPSTLQSIESQLYVTISGRSAGHAALMVKRDSGGPQP